ncbi:MAG: family 78 glycoside hydrolase catalytic domain, partial [Christensenellales bacterium]
MSNYVCKSPAMNTVERHVNAPVFRKVFTVGDLNKEYTVRIGAVGFYRLFAGGREITKGFFAPYISNPNHTVYYDTYNLNESLRIGENVLAVILGNGFSNSLDNGIWNFESASFRAAPKFFIEVSCDGKVILESDSSWKCSDFAITFDDLRCGERYDANLFDERVFCPGYDDSSWQNAVIADTPKGELLPCRAENITVCREICPVEITRSPRGYIYDFGEINSGICELSVNAERGQILDLYYGENRSKDGIDLSNISFGERSRQDYVQHDRYVCRDGCQVYTPSFTYHGFRYVEVVGLREEQVVKSLLKFKVLHSELKRSGYFR